jgi:uncharacterized membrane protein (DUF106 family)
VAETPSAQPAPRRSGGGFKFSTFILVFLGLLGLWMLIDTSTRNGVAAWLGNYNSPVGGGIGSGGTGWLYYLIGFNSNYLLVTMAVAGAIEMAITAIAYNYTTDWIKAAKVQKWSSAFRKVQMAAFRSGKKDRIDELKPFQQKIARMSSEVSIAQFKGMAITWFLLILIYSWVQQVIAAAPFKYVNLGGASVDLNASFGPFPIWFFIFSLYTVPLSFVFRRFLKHYWLLRYEERHPELANASTA